MIRTRVACVKVHHTNHRSIATDSKDVETMVLLNAASDEMSQNSNTHLKRFFLKFEGYLCVCVTEK